MKDGTAQNRVAAVEFTYVYPNNTETSLNAINIIQNLFLFVVPNNDKFVGCL